MRVHKPRVVAFQTVTRIGRYRPWIVVGQIVHVVTLINAISSRKQAAIDLPQCMLRIVSLLQTARSPCVRVMRRRWKHCCCGLP